MFFFFPFLLFSSSIYQIERGEYIDSNQNFEFLQNHPKTISDFLNQNETTDYALININHTSYFSPCQINLNQYSQRNILIKSDIGTQYVYLTGIQSIENKSLFFESVFINIKDLILKVFSLSLIQSPIFCSNGPISLFVDFLSSDYLSIPLNYVNNVNVSKHFYLFEQSHENPTFQDVPHAQITLLNNAGYSKSQICDKYDQSPKLLADEDQIEGEQPPKEDNYSIGYYFLNASLRRLNIYDNYIIAIFIDSVTELNLSTNSSNQILIETDSRRIGLEHYGSKSMFPIMRFELYLKVESILIFGQTFDSITNDRIVQNIIISHDTLVTLTSTTTVPYVTTIPLSYVIYIPAREVTENYCLCLRSRFQDCIRDEECLLHRVPESNYFFGTNSTFTAQMARSNSDIINVYVTSTNPNSNDYHTVEIKPSPRSGKTYNFISSISESYTNLRIQSSALDQSSAISLSFTDITNVLLRGGTGTVAKLALKNSSLTIGQSLSIPEVVSDLYSLSVVQPNSITVSSLFEISKGIEVHTVGLGIILAPRSFLSILQVSLFTQMTIGTGTISFTDGLNEILMTIQDNGPVGISIDETSKINPLLQIYCASTNQNLELNIAIHLTSDITLSYLFLDNNYFPEKVRFDFVPSETLSTLSLLLPPDPDDLPVGVHIYHFDNLIGPIDLILLTPATISSFFSAIIRQDFYTANLSKLTLNMIDAFDSVTLHEDGFVIGIINDLRIRINTTFVAGQLTLMTNKTDLITLSLNSPDMDFIPPFAIEAIDDNVKIFFDDSFNEIDPSVLSSIVVNHHFFNVTLMSNLETVPMVTVDDSIIGVLYEASQSYFELPSSRGNFRSGPDIVVNIGDKQNSMVSPWAFFNRTVVIDQSEFLAKTVTFQQNQFTFIPHSKSLVHYSFLNTTVNFDLSLNNVPTTFNAYQLTFSNSELSNSDCLIVTDYLTTDIASLTTNSFVVLNATKRCAVNDELLGGMIIDSDRIEFISNTTLLTSTKVFSKLFLITFGGHQPVNVSITSKRLDTIIMLNLIGDTNKTIYFDKSWHEIENIGNFIIIVDSDQSSKLTINCQLMEMPRITIHDRYGNRVYNYRLILYQPVFTELLSSYIFIGMFVLVLLISIILIIIGKCRYAYDPPKNRYAESDITGNFLSELNTQYETELQISREPQ